MSRKTQNYFSVKHSSGSFSEITSIRNEKGILKSIETIEEAKKVIDYFCDPSIERPEFDKERYAAYWESQRSEMKIFKVIHIEEEVKF